MAVKIIDNVGVVQSIPSINSEIVRDVSKPLSFYLIGGGSSVGDWSATVTFYEVDPVGYKKLGKSVSFTVSNKNPAELFTWASPTFSFVAHVSSIVNANVTVYMTQAVESSLERILLTEPSSGTKAMPSDVVNCTAEYVPGSGWIGGLGILESEAFLRGLPTNALVPGKVFAKVCTADSVVDYAYLSAGWNTFSSSYTVSAIPSAPVAGASYSISAYSGSRLSTNAQGKLGGTLGSAFADEAAVKLVPTANLALGTTAGGVLGNIWELRSAGWRLISAADPDKLVRYFNFLDLADDSPMPLVDSTGAYLRIFSPGGAIHSSPRVKNGGVQVDAVSASSKKCFYMDVGKFDSDADEAGAIFMLGSNLGTFCLAMWPDYSDVNYSNINSGCHLTITAGGVIFGVWEDNVIRNILTKLVPITTSAEHSIRAVFNGNKAIIYLDSEIVMEVSDPAIATRGRKVVCFEPYEDVGSAGYVSIKSGYAVASRMSRLQALAGGVIASQSLYSVASPITVNTGFATLIPEFNCGVGGSSTVIKYSGVVHLSQTQAGPVYINIAITDTVGVVHNTTRTISLSVKDDIVPFAGLISASGWQPAKCTVQIARASGVLATVPATTDLDSPSIVLWR